MGPSTILTKLVDDPVYDQRGAIVGKFSIIKYKKFEVNFQIQKDRFIDRAQVHMER